MRFFQITEIDSGPHHAHMVDGRVRAEEQSFRTDLFHRPFQQTVLQAPGAGNIRVQISLRASLNCSYLRRAVPAVAHMGGNDPQLGILIGIGHKQLRIAA